MFVLRLDDKKRKRKRKPATPRRKAQQALMALAGGESREAES